MRRSIRVTLGAFSIVMALVPPAVAEENLVHVRDLKKHGDAPLL